MAGAAKRVLFHCDQARSFRVLWTLNELKLDYDLVTMPFPPRAKAKGFKEFNSLGTIPYFLDGEVRMTESCGIPLYLVEQYDTTRQISVPPSDPRYGTYLNWLFHADATLTFPQTLYLRYCIFEKQRGLQEVGEDYKAWHLARMRLVQNTLRDGQQPYLLGDKFTIADIDVSYSIILGKQIGAWESYGPDLHAYMARLEKRPAFQAAFKHEKESLAAFDPAVFSKYSELPKL
eukprot:Clim_evm52s202 gene=Clim_evmTU52s202